MKVRDGFHFLESVQRKPRDFLESEKVLGDPRGLINDVPSTFLHLNAANRRNVPETKGTVLWPLVVTLGQARCAVQL